MNADTEKIAIQREPLRWLFVAHFSDGTQIVQDQEDKCLTRTDGTGSAFTDVIAREDELVSFDLIHVNGEEITSVDLKTGAFVINGTPIHVHDQYFDPSTKDLRLVYFRENRIDDNVLGEVQKNGVVSQELISRLHYTNRYFIGWQTTVGNKNKQSTIAVG